MNRSTRAFLHAARCPLLIGFIFAVGTWPERPASQNNSERKFQTSDRCIACHNGLTTPSGDGCFHRIRVARQHHGELVSRPLLAGERTP